MKKVTTGTDRTKAIDKLIENITNYPQNIQAAMRLTAKQTKLTHRALEHIYYGNKKKNIMGLRKTYPIMVTHTKAGMIINNKTTGVKSEFGKTLQLNNKLLGMEDLTNDQKAAWFDIILNK